MIEKETISKLEQKINNSNLLNVLYKDINTGNYIQVFNNYNNSIKFNYEKFKQDGKTFKIFVNLSLLVVGRTREKTILFNFC